MQTIWSNNKTHTFEERSIELQSIGSSVKEDNLGNQILRLSKDMNCIGPNRIVEIFYAEMIT